MSGQPANVTALEPPTQAAFLRAPMATVQKVAPKTIILGAGGTRRQAALAGISTKGFDYVQWSRKQLIKSLQLIFSHGAAHIITAVIIETSYNEVTPNYREKLIEWAAWVVGGAEALEDYRRLNWRIRFVGVESWPTLQKVAQHVKQHTEDHTGPTVWFTASHQTESYWDHLFALTQNQPIKNRQEAIRLVYGEDIPLAELFIGSGKPQVSASLVPPLLVGNLQCYWRQGLGYDLDQDSLRTILYDFAYLRKTWRQDKTGRAEEAVKYRHIWDNPPIIGMGQRFGPFWFPEATSEIAIG